MVAANKTQNFRKAAKHDGDTMAHDTQADLDSEQAWRIALASLIRWQSARYMGKDNQPRLASTIGLAEQTITGRLA